MKGPRPLAPVPYSLMQALIFAASKSSKFANSRTAAKTAACSPANLRLSSSIVKLSLKKGWTGYDFCPNRTFCSWKRETTLVTQTSSSSDGLANTRPASNQMWPKLTGQSQPLLRDSLLLHIGIVNPFQFLGIEGSLSEVDGRSQSKVQLVTTEISSSPTGDQPKIERR